MVKVLLYIWQLPQNLVGLLLLLWYKNEQIYHRVKEVTYYYTKEMLSGISLGNYVIMNWADEEDGMKHEYGHHIQSLILGWFYLPVVGIISLCGNIYGRIFHTKKRGWSYYRSYKWYYNQWQEKWADILGKVDREAYLEKIKAKYGE